jgi:hypothetical protein
VCLHGRVSAQTAPVARTLGETTGDYMAGIVRLGISTQWGVVVAVGYVGERYYWMLRNGVVSMMPAKLVESAIASHNNRRRATSKPAAAVR